MSRVSTPATGGVSSARWISPLISAMCSVYFAVMLVLAAWTLLPLLFGWKPLAIISGSMQPRVHVGDVVLIRAYSGEPLATGTVVTFSDPDQPERVITHRIAGRHPDGTYVTKGDANATPDSSHVPPSAIRGVARLLVPGAGMPLLWLRNGELAKAAGWAISSLLALAAINGTSSSSPASPYHSWVARREACETR